MKALRLGRFVVSSTIAEFARAEPAFGAYLLECVTRHQRGDWGDVDPEDRRLNDLAHRAGDARILSVYRLPGDFLRLAPDGKFWLITEADRSATTALWPSDY